MSKRYINNLRAKAGEAKLALAQEKIWKAFADRCFKFILAQASDAPSECQHSQDARKFCSEYYKEARAVE